MGQLNSFQPGLGGIAAADLNAILKARQTLLQFSYEEQKEAIHNSSMSALAGGEAQKDITEKDASTMLTDSITGFVGVGTQVGAMGAGHLAAGKINTQIKGLNAQQENCSAWQEHIDNHSGQPVIGQQPPAAPVVAGSPESSVLKSNFKFSTQAPVAGSTEANRVATIARTSDIDKMQDKLDAEKKDLNKQVRNKEGQISSIQQQWNTYAQIAGGASNAAGSAAKVSILNDKAAQEILKSMYDFMNTTQQSVLKVLDENIQTARSGMRSDIDSLGNQLFQANSPRG